MAQFDRPLNLVLMLSLVAGVQVLISSCFFTLYYTKLSHTKNNNSSYYLQVVVSSFNGGLLSEVLLGF